MVERSYIMNFYNPYGGYFVPQAIGATARSGGFLSGLFRNGINWGTIFNNTQKTLGFVNQVIPVVRQATPLVRNARTMWRVMNEFRKSDSFTNSNNTSQTSQSTQPQNNTSPSRSNTEQRINNSGPTFFA